MLASISDRTVSVGSRIALAPRDPNGEHRTATPLELFFDLTFVAAVAQRALPSTTNSS